VSGSPDSDEVEFVAWLHHRGLCPECEFNWDEGDFEVLVEQCMADVEKFDDVLQSVDSTAPVAPGLWSATAYIWHTVDVLRFGAERFWTLTFDPSFGVPAWEENETAAVRFYDQLSPVVGIVALISAAETWRSAARDTPRNVDTAHPEAGTISAFDLVQRNAHEVRHHLVDIRRALSRVMPSD
jgi:hypothetical protein